MVSLFRGPVARARGPGPRQPSSPPGLLLTGAGIEHWGADRVRFFQQEYWVLDYSFDIVFAASTAPVVYVNTGEVHTLEHYIGCNYAHLLTREDGWGENGNGELETGVRGRECV